MNEERLDELLWQEIDGRITPDDRQRLQAYLAENDAARKRQREIATLAAGLDAVAELEPPSELRGRIHAALAGSVAPSLSPPRGQTASWLGGLIGRLWPADQLLRPRRVFREYTKRSPGHSPRQPNQDKEERGMAELSTQGKWVLAMGLVVVLAVAVVLLSVEDSALREEALTGAAGVAGSAATSELLLPYFEVDLQGSGLTTFFAVVNGSPKPVEVEVRVFSNWGVEILELSLELQGNETRSVNLADWLVAGNLPGGSQLTADELEQYQAALTGQLAPDDLYYSTEVEIGRIVGFLTLSAQHNLDVIFGDYFIVDPLHDFAQGEVLVDIAKNSECDLLCTRHGLRFLEGGVFDGGTEVVIWTGGTSRPSSGPFFEGSEAPADIYAYKQDGELVGQENHGFMPLQVLKVSELSFDARSGWLDILTDRASFMTVRYSSRGFSVALQTSCLPPKFHSSEPKIRLEKLTNGRDADTPALGPKLDRDEDVEWRYVVSNIGGEALTDIVVEDDMEGAIICDQDTLAVGESMTCIASGTAECGEYVNLGTVTGRGTESDKTVSDRDPSHYSACGVDVLPQLLLEKYTLGGDSAAAPGDDADQPTGPSIPAGAPVVWTYVVTNGSRVEIFDIEVTDDQGVRVECPKTKLAPNESMSCTGRGTAIEGQYANLGIVLGNAITNGNLVEGIRAEDPSHYFGTDLKEPAIDVEKATDDAAGNPRDADTGTGPGLTAGNTVTWTYVVSNTGNVDLSNVRVTDDKEGAIGCPKSTLAVGESMTCTHTGTAQLGQYANLATATATGDNDSGSVTDSDPSHYHAGPRPKPAIDVEKATDDDAGNPRDADTGTGPGLTAGNTVTWTYVVSNTGNVDLSNVRVTDDKEGAIGCPKSTLAVGESMTCTHTGTAQLGQYANLATATATGDNDSGSVTDSDPSHYFAQGDEGFRGCTPGYWKAPQHHDSWAATPYSTSQATQSVFAQAAAYPAEGSASLVEALDFGGGGGVEGGVRNLLRAAVAGLLNSSHDGVNYPRTTASLISAVDAALASGDRNAMLSLASSIDRDNNMDCPLN